MPTYGELIPLLHWAYSNSENDGVAREIMDVFCISPFSEGQDIVANTGVLRTQKGMFVQDKPKFRKVYSVYTEEEGRYEVSKEKFLKSSNEFKWEDTSLSMNADDLETVLRNGHYQQHGIYFSTDNSIRFTEWGELFRRRRSARHLRQNPYVLALVGDMERVEMLVDMVLRSYGPGLDTCPTITAPYSDDDVVFGAGGEWTPTLAMDDGLIFGLTVARILEEEREKRDLVEREKEMETPFLIGMGAISCGINGEDTTEKIALSIFKPKERNESFYYNPLTGSIAENVETKKESFMQKMSRFFKE